MSLLLLFAEPNALVTGAVSMDDVEAMTVVGVAIPAEPTEPAIVTAAVVFADIETMTVIGQRIPAGGNIVVRPYTGTITRP